MVTGGNIIRFIITTKNSNQSGNLAVMVLLQSATGTSGFNKKCSGILKCQSDWLNPSDIDFRIATEQVLSVKFFYSKTLHLIQY